MHIVLGVFTIYAIYLALTVSIIATTARRNRRHLSVMAALVPFLIVGAISSTFLDLILRRESTPGECPARLEAAEKLIEERRIEVFNVAERDIWMATFLNERYRQHLSKQAQSMDNMLDLRKAA